VESFFPTQKAKCNGEFLKWTPQKNNKTPLYRSNRILTFRFWHQRACFPVIFVRETKESYAGVITPLLIVILVLSRPFGKLLIITVSQNYHRILVNSASTSVSGEASHCLASASNLTMPHAKAYRNVDIQNSCLQTLGLDNGPVFTSHLRQTTAFPIVTQDVLPSYFRSLPEIWAFYSIVHLFEKVSFCEYILMQPFAKSTLG